MSLPYTKGYDGKYYYKCIWCQKEIICFNDRHCVQLILNHYASHDVALPLLQVAVSMIHEALSNLLSQMMKQQQEELTHG